jgi:hypothetical protein
LDEREKRDKLAKAILADWHARSVASGRPSDRQPSVYQLAVIFTLRPKRLLARKRGDDLQQIPFALRFGRGVSNLEQNMINGMDSDAGAQFNEDVFGPDP